MTSLGTHFGVLCSFRTLQKRKVYSNNRTQILRSTAMTSLSTKKATPQGLIFNSICKPFVIHRFQSLFSACRAHFSLPLSLVDCHKETLWKWNHEAVWTFWRREKRLAHSGIRNLDREARSLVAVPITPWVSKPLPARMYYVARGHICKQCI